MTTLQLTASETETLRTALELCMVEAELTIGGEPAHLVHVESTQWEDTYSLETATGIWNLTWDGEVTVH